MPETKDLYCNQAYMTCVESAANTLTFNKLETGISIYEKVGWLISRFDYYFSDAISNFGAEGDAVTFGLATSDVITSVAMSSNPVIDFNKITRHDIGTAASGFFTRWPYIKSFAELPGGGLLVPPNPLYLYTLGTGLGSAVTMHCRMFYTVKKLKVEDYWELVELRRMIGG